MPFKYIFSLIIFFFINSQAQNIRYNEEFQVNTYTDSWQSKPSVTGLSGGGFVVSWSSSGQVHSSDVFGQRFDANGSRIGEEFLVNSDTFNNQSQPSAGSLNNGGFVIVWSGQNANIFGQMYHNNGSKNGQQFKINTYTQSSQNRPCVAGLLDGGFAVAWQSNGQDGYETGIFGQVFNVQGEKRGEEFQVNTQTENWQWNPKICALSKGRFVITWESEDEYELGNRMGVHARQFDSNGKALSEEVIVRSHQNSSSRYPDICSLSNGGFVICWEGSGGDNWDGYSTSIFGQVFDSTGARVGEGFLANSYKARQSQTTVCGLADGGFVICWESHGQDGSGYGVYAQIYDKNALKRGEEYRVNSHILDYQEEPSISGLSEGGFVACWQSMYQDGSLTGIYGKYFLKTPIQHSLQTFSLISPAFDATVMTTTVNFKWQEANSVHVNFPWELIYTLYLDESDDFNDPEIFSDIYDTTYSVEDLTLSQTYFWRVLAKNIEGDSLWSSESFGFYVSPAANIKDEQILKPETFKLYQNYPNPFNPSTVVSYQLPVISDVELSIYDILGHKVTTIVNFRQNAGYHQVEWDASDFSSGVYFVVLEAGNFNATQKMLLVK